MISSFSRISRREEINELFEQLGKVLEQRVEALLIGGAVMLELGLKDSTKDIDIVCRREEDKEALLASAKALGFQIVGPQKRHERLGVNRLAVKGGRNLDIFAGRISYDFGLSGAIWQRATRIRFFGSLVVRDASIEDIFTNKTATTSRKRSASSFPISGGSRRWRSKSMAPITRSQKGWAACMKMLRDCYNCRRNRDSPSTVRISSDHLPRPLPPFCLSVFPFPD